MLKTIGLTLLISLIFISCKDRSEEGKKHSDAFFNYVISKNYSAAAQCIDQKSAIYPKRYQFIHELASDSILGQLHSIGGGIMARATTHMRSSSISSWEFGEKLNYDSTSISVDIKVIDVGNGPKISEIIRR